MTRTHWGISARAACPCLAAAIVLASGAALLLAPSPLAAQSAGRITIGPSIGARGGALRPRGLPPATLRDYTGRSPGALRPGTTSPGAPYIVPPAYRGKPDVRLRKQRLPPPRQYVD